MCWMSYTLCKLVQRWWGGVKHNETEAKVAAAILQTTFWNQFSCMKWVVFWIKFHWCSFPRAQLTICQCWFRNWLFADQATSHYLKQWWSSLSMRIRVIRPWWFNTRSAVRIHEILSAILNDVIWSTKVIRYMYDNQTKTRGTVVIAEPADGLVPTGARTSADTMTLMIKSESRLWFQ